MKDKDRERTLLEIAREAVDEDEIAEMFERTTGDDCDYDAVRALHEVTASALVRDLLAAVEHARLRGREPTGDDVGDAVERQRDCCGQTISTQHAMMLSSDPDYGAWVT